MIFFLGRKLFSYERINYKREYITYYNLYRETKRKLEYMKKQCDIFHLKPATGELREQQLRILDFTIMFLEQIKHLDIKPILASGNLLGAWRHGGYIPWDDDMDFYLIRSDYEKLINWCKENAVVCHYEGKLSEYTPYEVAERLHKRVTDHPNEWVVDIWYNQIQISRGSCYEDQLFVDFFPLDYYKDSYSFDEHKKRYDDLHEMIRSIDQVSEATKILRNEAHTNVNIAMESANIYHGFDGLTIKKWHTGFLSADVVYPLRKVKFEHLEFWAPNKIEEFLDFEFADKTSFPDDVGFSSHNEIKKLYAKSH